MLGRLQFRGVWRQEQQVDMLGHVHLGTVVPASAVKHEHDLFGRTGADRRGERFKFHREELNVHGCRQVPHGAPRGGMHKPHQIAPVIPMLDGGDGALAGQRPDSLEDRLEPDAVLVDRPQLNGRLAESGRNRAQQRAQPSLEVCLGLHVGVHMAGAGHPQPCAQPPQVPQPSWRPTCRPRR
jgi:hypothetical protein